MKNSILQQCLQPCEVPYTRMEVCSSTDLDGDLDARCNEWRLLHGTSPEQCRKICEEGFDLSMAGTGHTWKASGEGKGTPLYGFGAYFAERITKADEYASAISEGEEGEGLFCALVCRVIGGRTNAVKGNTTEVSGLRKAVFEGPYHSVLGDRVSSLGKPYREVVAYEAAQIYPEFLLMYARSYD